MKETNLHANCVSKESAEVDENECERKKKERKQEPRKMFRKAYGFELK